MNGPTKDLIKYRIARAKETFEDAKLLAEKHRWNSAINRLYYAAFYAIIALLLKENHKSTTHNGVKTKFSDHFIKTGLFPTELARIYSQLFTWGLQCSAAPAFSASPKNHRNMLHKVSSPKNSLLFLF